MTAPAITSDQAREAWRRLQERAWEMGDFYGLPYPVPGAPVTLETRHPRRAELEQALRSPENGVRACRTEDVDDSIQIRAEWYSRRLGTRVWVYSETSPDGKLRYRHLLDRLSDVRLKLMWDTLHATLAFDGNQEARALARLATLVTSQAFERYVVGGAFIETSSRSGVAYLFRRLRPTIAVRVDRENDQVHFLAALCLHPLGYYEGTHTGALCPTDDVIAHLMLMRGDEHMFWRRSNQHPAWAPEAGI